MRGIRRPFSQQSAFQGDVRERLCVGRNQEKVVTETGKAFILDGHNSWMLYEEAMFWKRCRQLDEAEWKNGPWVNGKMPAQYAP